MIICWWVRYRIHKYIIPEYYLYSEVEPKLDKSCKFREAIKISRNKGYKFPASASTFVIINAFGKNMFTLWKIFFQPNLLLNVWPSRFCIRVNFFFWTFGRIVLFLFNIFVLILWLHLIEEELYASVYLPSK